MIKANILGVEREHDFYGILLGMLCLCLATRKHQQTQLRFKLRNGRRSKRVEYRPRLRKHSRLKEADKT